MSRCHRFAGSTCRSSRRRRVAGGPQGLYARAGRRPAGPRAGVGGVFQPGDRERSRVRRGLHHAVDGLRQPRRVAAQRGVRQARQRGDQTAQRARAALDRLSVPRPRDRQPGFGRRALELWKAAYPRGFQTRQRAGGDLQPHRPYDRAVAEAQEALRRSRGIRFRCRTSPSRFERSAATPTRGGPPRKLCSSVSKPRRPAAPLSARARRGRRLRRGPPGLGEEQTARIRPGVRGSAGCRVRGRLRDAAGLYQRAIDIALARG